MISLIFTKYTVIIERQERRSSNNNKIGEIKLYIYIQLWCEDDIKTLVLRNLFCPHRKDGIILIV